MPSLDELVRRFGLLNVDIPLVNPGALPTLGNAVRQAAENVALRTRGTGDIGDNGKNPYLNQIDLYQQSAQNRDKPLYIGKLGSPVFTNITFLPNSYTDNNGKLQSFKQLVFDTVLMTVSQQKKIVKTEIQGRDGAVKEYIGQDDYTIQINGIITGGNGHYPIDEVRDLKDMLNAPIEIDVASWYLQNLDIHTLVVTDYTIAQEAGGYSQQPFSITASSDLPIELRITNV